MFDRDWWRTYVSVNERFAEAHADVSDVDLWWVHDYHLMLLPGLLRRAGTAAPVSFLPAHAMAATRAVRTAAVATADPPRSARRDIVSFHTQRYRKSFLRTCGRVLADEGVRVAGHTVRLADGRQVRTAANPISIDNGEFARLATSDEVSTKRRRLERQFHGRLVLLGVDRLDYTKGIAERPEAFELLLARRPDLRTRVVLVQVAVPSRGQVREYRGLRAQVEGITGRINGRFTEPGHDVPVHYLHRGVSREHLIAYYCHADVMLVTPLKDGMNLVAKEFVVCQSAVGRVAVLDGVAFDDVDGAADALCAAVESAHRHVMQEASRAASRRGMSTTLTAVIIHHRAIVLPRTTSCKR